VVETALIYRLITENKVYFLSRPRRFGRADLIVENQDCVYIFEFKLFDSAENALKQIEEKGYAVPYLADSRKIVKVGVELSAVTRNVAKWLIA
jgi:hypothetical protein